MKTCAICGKPLNSGVVVHPECVPKWISVEDKLPEDCLSQISEEYIVRNYESGGISIRCLVRHKVKSGEIVTRISRRTFYPESYFHGWECDRVICWMPLPEPPKEENNAEE